MPPAEQEPIQQLSEPQTPPQEPPESTTSPAPTEVREHHGYWELPGETPELYDRLGVQTYKKFIPTSGDRVRRLLRTSYGGMKETDSVESQLSKTIKFTKVNEVLHLGFIGIMAYEQATSEQTIENTALWAAAQIGVNVYPIMVQRYNRLRAYRVQRRLAALANKRAMQE